MDTSWISSSRVSTTYLKGLDTYLDHMFSTESVNGEITCPCIKCCNQSWVDREQAKTHLVCDGFFKGFKIESSVNEEFDTPMWDAEDDMQGLVHDALHRCDVNIQETEEQGVPNTKAKKFYRVLDDANKELYPGCKKFSVLSFVVRLYHSKCVGKCNDKGFSMMLDTLREAFPEASIPKSLYELKKLIRELGLGYEKIDACPNDCMLYWKENKDKTQCDICETSRYKTKEDDSEDEETTAANDHKVPAKVLRYFPLIPRLQRLYMSSASSSSMRWHDEDRKNDGLLRHPADSPAWKTFDHNNPEFAKEPCNVRLGLASDGFNPFSNMSVSHSTWPVVLVVYNLPPWMCMKKPYFLLTLLIPGPSAPGNNIDIYLQPLVDELIELWEKGVETYDSSRKRNFRLRAALLWTISDFPAYANLSGWSTKGRLACPSCHKHTRSIRLKRCRKFVFMAHRRWMAKRHAYRKDTKSFDNTEEMEMKPRSLTGTEVFELLKGFEMKFGKLVKTNPVLPDNWKKLSIFFKLPYWKNNLLRHNLDVMHIEKNVCDSVIGTLLNLDGKTKDHLNARYDLQEMGIREELHPEDLENNKVYLPPACFTMNSKEKSLFCTILKGVKVPDGYSSNISRCVQLKPTPKLSGLKSHDNHILMQQLLPIAIRNVLPKHVRSIVMKLCRYFRQLCLKVLNPSDLGQMEKEIGKILCDLEKNFPPSFFDVMVHLAVHLATEAKLGGPVHYRWMYPIERYLGTLKSYVRNRSKPEGSIAEGYLSEECMSFCSLYLSDSVETIHNKISRNYDDGGNEDGLPIFAMPGRPVGATRSQILDLKTLAVAHSIVLFNCTELEPFRKEHLALLRRQHQKATKHVVQRLHSQNFAAWFQDHVKKLHKEGDTRITEDIKQLASAPSEYVRKYKGYIVNGYRFHTKYMEKKRKTQNSGVMLEAMTDSFSSVRDSNPTAGNLTYYGVLNDIIELQYAVGKKVVLFKCDWVSDGSRCKEDENGFTLVRFAHSKKRDKEPYILASLAQQVFYVKDHVHKGWKVVIKTKARDYYDMEAQASIDDVDTHLQSETGIGPQINEDENIELVRSDLDGTVVESTDLVFDTPEDQAEDQGEDQSEDEATDQVADDE